MSDWKPYAVRLADQLRANGDLKSPAWHAAIAETPRHILVPTVYQPPEEFYGPITNTRLNTAEHLELIYSTTTLVTALAPDQYGTLVASSSSTKPDLMVRMLETLDVREGQRVLEIGTGTGYNAALLAHRLGDDHVFSVDIDPELVSAARRRLAGISRQPHLTVGDGAQGWPAHAPYDRIIATCAVRRIPWAWYEQLTPGGRLLADFTPHGGNLVLLGKKDDRLEGRFTARFAAFMAMRQPDNPDERPPTPWRPAFALERTRTTTTPAEPSGAMRFLRAAMSSTQLRQKYTFDEQTRRPTAIRLATADGSCCEVDLTPGGDGRRTVREGGPTPLWREMERAYQQWCEWGKPGWERIGITVTPDTWAVWLDEPTHILTPSGSPCRAVPAWSRSRGGSSRPSSESPR